MGNDQHRLADPQVANDDVGEIWQKPGDHVSQTFGERATADVGVTRVGVLAELTAPLDRRRRRVIAAPPGHELLFAIAGLGLGLVQTLQRAVVAFVEPPATPHGNPEPIGAVQRQMRGGDRAPQQRGVEHVGQ